MLRAVLQLVVWATAAASAAAKCPLVFQQNFNQYGTGIRTYNEAMVRRDFPRVQGPFKMLGEGGTCKVKDATLQTFFPKGALPRLRSRRSSQLDVT